MYSCKESFKCTCDYKAKCSEYRLLSDSYTSQAAYALQKAKDSYNEATMIEQRIKYFEIQLHEMRCLAGEKYALAKELDEDYQKLLDLAADYALKSAECLKKCNLCNSIGK